MTIVGSGRSFEITIYDMNSKIIGSYEALGNVNVYTNNRVIYRDREGRAHEILFTTGTILIDEK